MKVLRLLCFLLCHTISSQHSHARWRWNAGASRQYRWMGKFSEHSAEPGMLAEVCSGITYASNVEMQSMLGLQNDICHRCVISEK